MIQVDQFSVVYFTLFHSKKANYKHTYEGFRQFCKVVDIFVKALYVTYFWPRKAPFERLKRELPRGVWGRAPAGN